MTATSLSQHRKIIHIDMDAFYAAVEQRDFPEWRGRPVIVGGSPDTRGVVATCSYEARAFGIRSAMPASHARRLCPEAIFVRPRFEVYRAISAEIRHIFKHFTPQVEAISLDEAYLDVTHSDILHGSASLMAQDIRDRIHNLTGLTASAGVSFNKFLAKIASDRHKPDGFCLILPEQAPAIIRAMPIGAFHGIGRATETRMKALEIHSGSDLESWPLDDLRRHFGRSAEYYYQIARGLDERPVRADRIRKSWGAETTFQTDLADPETMLIHLQELARRVLVNMAQKNLTASTLTVKVKYADFEQVTRSLSLTRPFSVVTPVPPHLRTLLDRTEAGQRKVRLLGVSFSSLTGTKAPSEGQLDLFSDRQGRES